MSWRTLLEPFRFFALAAVALFGAGIVALARGRTGVPLDIFIRDRYFIVSSLHLYFLLGAFCVFFAGIYASIRRRRAGPGALLLGQLHFWISLAPVLLLFHRLHVLAADPLTDTQSEEFRALVHSHARFLVGSFLTFLLAQVFFLVNLALSFRKGTSSGE